MLLVTKCSYLPQPRLRVIYGFFRAVYGWLSAVYDTYGLLRAIYELFMEKINMWKLVRKFLKCQNICLSFHGALQRLLRVMTSYIWIPVNYLWMLAIDSKVAIHKGIRQRNLAIKIMETKLWNNVFHYPKSLIITIYSIIMCPLLFVCRSNMTYVIIS